MPAQATFFEELVKKLLKGKSRLGGDDGSESDNDHPRKNEAEKDKVPTWPTLADITVWMILTPRGDFKPPPPPPSPSYGWVMGDRPFVLIVWLGGWLGVGGR